MALAVSKRLQFMIDTVKDIKNNKRNPHNPVEDLLQRSKKLSARMFRRGGDFVFFALSPCLSCGPRAYLEWCVQSTRPQAPCACHGTT